MIEATPTRVTHQPPCWEAAPRRARVGDGSRLSWRCRDRRSRRRCRRVEAAAAGSVCRRHRRRRSRRKLVRSAVADRIRNIRPVARRRHRLPVERGRRADVSPGPHQRHDRRRVKVGDEPEGVTVRPDGAVVYVTCEETARSGCRHADLQGPGEDEDGSRPRAVVFTTDGATASSPTRPRRRDRHRRPGRTRWRPRSRVPQPRHAPVPPRPMGVVLSPDGRCTSTSLGRYKAVGVIERRPQAGTDHRQRRRSAVGHCHQRRWPQALHRERPVEGRLDHRRRDGTVAKRIDVGGSPWGVVVGTGR